MSCEKSEPDRHRVLEKVFVGIHLSESRVQVESTCGKSCSQNEARRSEGAREARRRVCFLFCSLLRILVPLVPRQLAWRSFEVTIQLSLYRPTSLPLHDPFPRSLDPNSSVDASRSLFCSSFLLPLSHSSPDSTSSSLHNVSTPISAGMMLLRPSCSNQKTLETRRPSSETTRSNRNGVESREREGCNKEL